MAHKCGSATATLVPQGASLAPHAPVSNGKAQPSMPKVTSPTAVVRTNGVATMQPQSALAAVVSNSKSPTSSSKMEQLDGSGS